MPPRLDTIKVPRCLNQQLWAPVVRGLAGYPPQRTKNQDRECLASYTMSLSAGQLPLYFYVFGMEVLGGKILPATLESTPDCSSALCFGPPNPPGIPTLLPIGSCIGTVYPSVLTSAHPLRNWSSLPLPAQGCPGHGVHQYPPHL